MLVGSGPEHNATKDVVQNVLLIGQVGVKETVPGEKTEGNGRELQGPPPWVNRILCV
jgi:hypothetical protein